MRAALPKSWTATLLRRDLRGGVRSMIAASVLQAEGFASVLNVEGGMDAWNSAQSSNRNRTCGRQGGGS